MATAMSRIARTSAVSPQVYRHFAMITIAITACVALFADGESPDGFQQQLAAREARNDLLAAEKAKLGERHLKMGKLHLRDGKESFMPFGPDENSFQDDGGGGPVAGNASGVMYPDSATRNSDPASDAGVGGPPAAVIPPGISLGGAQDEARQRERRKRTATKPTPDQVAAMMAASNARSANAAGE